MSETVAKLNPAADPELGQENSGYVEQIVVPELPNVKFQVGEGGGENGPNFDLEDHEREHTRHNLFCELEELEFNAKTDELEWKEKARWIKFEEDVEECGERWSKPHVASLSLNALFELKESIKHGHVMFDLEAATFADIADQVVEELRRTEFSEEVIDKVYEAVLSKHTHQHERHQHHHGSALLKKLSSSVLRPNASKNSLTETFLSRVRQSMSGPSGGSGENGSGPLSFTKDGALSPTPQPPRNDSNKVLKRNESSGSFGGGGSHADLHKLNKHFMKKLPRDAEGANISVGGVDFLDKPVTVFIRLGHSTLMADLTEVPVPTRFFFLLLGPKSHLKDYHEVGRCMSTLLSDKIFQERAYKAETTRDLLDGIKEFMSSVTVLPPGEWDPSIRIEPPSDIKDERKMPGEHVPNGDAADGKDPDDDGHPEEEGGHGSDPALTRTGRLFGGLIMDIKRRAPFYLSDFKDAFHMQTVASVLFMFFACISPIITFGGLLGDATDQNISTMESLLSGAICGISYALFSGQPLTIIGSTGPVLVFETIVFQFSTDQGWNYLSFRFWIGLWVCLILLIMVAFDLSALVRYITRFTEESFACLISLIFIVEAFKKVVQVGDKAPVNTNPDAPLNYTCYCVPLNGTANASLINWANVTRNECIKLGGALEGPGCDTPHYISDVFLLSILLFAGTFLIAFLLKLFKDTNFFPTFVRDILADFSVVIAIGCMTATDIVCNLHTPKLLVPLQFRPTRPDRDWVVDPFKGNPWWTALAALAPALLATILIFMDQQITAVIVNRKENMLKKGCGYHLDLLLIALQIGICSVIGTPWFVAATVLAITHVHSLQKVSEASAPGEKRQFLGCREQRVTGIIIFLMCGLSVLLASVLKYVPMPVLYGVFLYMGISSLKGSQLVDRAMMVFMPRKYQPDVLYLRHVSTIRVHLFTLIQVVCLAILWTIKSIKSISIIFPIMVLAMCFVRKGLDWVFTRDELMHLDDVLPEEHKREKEDKKKKEKDDKLRPNKESVLDLHGVDSLEVHLDSGKVMHIKTDNVKFGKKKRRGSHLFSSDKNNEKGSKNGLFHRKKSSKDKMDTLEETTKL